MAKQPPCFLVRALLTTAVVCSALLIAQPAHQAWARIRDLSNRGVAATARQKRLDTVPEGGAAPPPGPAFARGRLPAARRTPNGCRITPLSLRAEATLLALINRHRAAVRVPALRLNRVLSAASRDHSCDMFLHHKLSHFGSDGSSPLARFPATLSVLAYEQVGENVGTVSGLIPPAAVADIDHEMMVEPLVVGDHHWNILNKGYSIVGIGIIVARHQTWITEDFAG